MNKMLKRKYVGVPTQEEIMQQYKEIKDFTKNITTFEQVLNFSRGKIENIGDIEINNDSISYYNNEPIKTIRYEYKNILFYVDIKNNNVKPSEYITLYSDDCLQFDDELYYNYNKEIDKPLPKEKIKVVYDLELTEDQKELLEDYMKENNIIF